MKDILKETKEALVVGFIVFATFQLAVNTTPANTYVGDGFSFSYPEGWTPDGATAILMSQDGNAFVEASVVSDASLQALALVQLEAPDRYPQEVISIGGRSWTKTCAEASGFHICRAFTKCNGQAIVMGLKERAGTHNTSHGLDYIEMLAHFRC